MAQSGTQTQLAIKGPQDAYLISPREATFWRRKYNRHTNFAMCEIENSFSTNTGFGIQRMQAKINRAGDLLAQMYLYVELPPIVYTNPAVDYDITAVPMKAAYYTNAIGHAMIDEAVIEIGQQEYDNQTGEYMELVETLTAPPERLMGAMTGRFFSTLGQVFACQNIQYLYVPFKFWFNRWYEQALPEVALYWHETNLRLQTKPVAQLYRTSGGSNITAPGNPSTMLVICNFVYLDDIERDAFSKSDYEIIYDSTQRSTDTHTNTQYTQTFNIKFNHPTQEVMWVMQRDTHATNLDWFNYDGVWGGTPDTHPMDAFETAAIWLNGMQRTINHRAQYYRLVQPHERHTRLPLRWVYSYAFGILPEHILDTGSVNMSRFDTAELRVIFPSAASGRNWSGFVRVYARHKQIARIVSGLMGKKYAG